MAHRHAVGRRLANCSLQAASTASVKGASWREVDDRRAMCVPVRLSYGCRHDASWRSTSSIRVPRQARFDVVCSRHETPSFMESSMRWTQSSPVLFALLLGSCVQDTMTQRATPSPPPSSAIALTVLGPAIRGESFTLRVELPVPRDGLRVLLPTTDGGLGAGACPPPLNGECLGIIGQRTLVGPEHHPRRGRIRHGVPLDYPSDEMAVQATIPTRRGGFLSEPMLIPILDPPEVEVDIDFFVLIHGWCRAAVQRLRHRRDRLLRRQPRGERPAPREPLRARRSRAGELRDHDPVERPRRQRRDKSCKLENLLRPTRPSATTRSSRSATTSAATV